jgi:flotillin
MEGLERLLPELTATAPVVIVAVVVGLWLLIWAMRNLLYICPPNEVLIFSGSRKRLEDGTVVGFRAIFGGRGWRKPFFEKVDRISLNTIEVPIMIRGAYSRGGIPLNVDAIANVKISSNPVVIGNAIERFLGRDRNEIRRVAKETLEGHLRGVLATLTPEEVNEDRLKFAESLSKESEEDLSKLGLHVDTLKIQHVTDDVHYLDSIGRSAIANIHKEAEMAESDCRRAAEQAEAENSARSKVVKAEVEARIAQMRNELRKLQADLEAEVRAEEERTAAAARETRARAEQELQQVRAELETVRLQVDTVLPSEANRVAQEYRARGEAAIIRERGKAVADALDLLYKAWREAGSAALQIALIEDIEKILASAAKGVAKVQVDALHLIDAGDGQTLQGYVSAYPRMLEGVFAAVERTTGIDIQGALRGQTPPSPNPASGTEAKR